MIQYRQLLDRLQEHRDLPDAGLSFLVSCTDPAVQEDLAERSRSEAQRVFGREVYLRGLVEWSNVCCCDCLYCGIRASNASLSRYTLDRETLLRCAENVYSAGIRTLVIQGGENPSAARSLVEIVAEISGSWPLMAITLSLGELPFSLYKAFREAGAHRYLLRHETASSGHYARLHPAGKTLERRLECLRELRRLGFQVGMGMMVGSPFQTEENLLEDLRLLQSFQPEMIGIGPFIPQSDTPLGSYPAGDVETTLRLISILRLMMPEALIPATTALATLAPGGRRRGLLSGANVIMPNFTPAPVREAYRLYDNKSHEELDTIKTELASIGYGISPSRGDYHKC